VKILAEVSLYPLRTPSLSEPIDEFVDHLRRAGLSVELTSMSTRIEGESGTLLEAIRDAFETVATGRDVVLTLTISNACPSTS
jgi:uncharacterized protein YqgV (UPF0045/DUF77 family)